MQSIVHTVKAEAFLQKAIDLPRFAGGAFDFISMCPPYLLVSYPELFDLLNRSHLTHPGTILFVEYPKQLTAEIPATVCGLVQVRNWEARKPGLDGRAHSGTSTFLGSKECAI